MQDGISEESPPMEIVIMNPEDSSSEEVKQSPPQRPGVINLETENSSNSNNSSNPIGVRLIGLTLIIGSLLIFDNMSNISSNDAEEVLGSLCSSAFFGVFLLFTGIMMIRSTMSNKSRGQGLTGLVFDYSFANQNVIREHLNANESTHDSSITDAGESTNSDKSTIEGQITALFAIGSILVFLYFMSLLSGLTN